MSSSNDTQAESDLIRKLSLEAGADEAVSANHWAEGGAGATDLAKAVISACKEPTDFKLLYEDSLSLKDKILTIATEMYGAKDVSYTDEAEKQLQLYTDQGYAHLPSESGLLYYRDVLILSSLHGQNAILVLG